MRCLGSAAVGVEQCTADGCAADVVGLRRQTAVVINTYWGHLMTMLGAVGCGSLGRLTAITVTPSAAWRCWRQNRTGVN